MKLFKPFFLIALFSLIIISNSCKVTYPNEKYMNGRWTPVKVERFVEPGSVATTPAPAPKSSASTPAKSTENPDSTTITLKKRRNNNAIPPELERENLIQRHILAEQKACLEVNQEKKMVVKVYPGKTIKATWKMKNKGTRITTKNIETGKKSTIDILEINDTSAVLLERFLIGNIKVTYHKDVK